MHKISMMKLTESLAEKCINVIVKNFRNFHDLSDFTRLPISLKKIIFSIVSKRGFVNDTNIRIFIDDQTKKLELSECLNLTPTGLLEITICKNLKTLDLNSHHISRVTVTSDVISNLSYSCKHLQTVLLSRCVSIDDECVEALAKNCKFLADLNLGGCILISDRSLVALGNYCHNLRSIYISRTNISDKGIFSLMTDNVSKVIEEIHMAHCDNITDEGIECILINSKSIKYLMFHCCKKTTDASRQALEDYMMSSTNQKVKHLTWSIY